MSVRTQALVLVALGLVAACAESGEAPDLASAADSAAIAALSGAEVMALAKGDTTLAYLADDIHFMPDDEPAIHGIAAARAWVVGFLSMYRATVNYTNTSVVFGGDLAVETYSGTLTTTPVAGGEPATVPVKGLHVYRRDAAGTWKMVQDIWNSDAPVVAP